MQTIPVNEVFGPTIQGEGMEMGSPCFFLRLHHCPVKCPGCDTAYTWNGAEDGRSLPILSHPDEEVKSLEDTLVTMMTDYPGAGLVVSGGEPLLQYRNAEFRDLLHRIRKTKLATWTSLETSGFLGIKPLFSKVVHKTPDYTDLDRFLVCFDSVHLSPKITPCLHGTGWTDTELEVNVTTIVDVCRTLGPRIALKLVCRDKEDVEAVLRFIDRMGSGLARVPIYLMPYGQEPDEIRQATEVLIPYAAKHGFLLSPRIHSLLWGKERKR